MQRIVDISTENMKLIGCTEENVLPTKVFINVISGKNAELLFEGYLNKKPVVFTYRYDWPNGGGSISGGVPIHHVDNYHNQKDCLGLGFFKRWPWKRIPRKEKKRIKKVFAMVLQRSKPFQQRQFPQTTTSETSAF